MAETYIYTTTDAREVNTIINNGLNHIVLDLSMQDGKRVQTDLGLKFNPASYIKYNKLFSAREMKSIVDKLTRDRQFVAVSNDQGIKHYFPSGFEN